MIRKSSFIIFIIFILFFVSCTSYIAKQKKQEEAIRNLGEAYMAEGKYTLALRELLRAEEIYHNDPFLHNDLGLVYMVKGKNDLAIDHFKKAVSLKHDYAPALNNLGNAYMAKGDWDMAIACFQKVTKNLLYVTPHKPLSNMGWAYYKKKEYKLAEKYFLDALELQPEFLKALLGLGQTYIMLNRLPEAVATLETAVTVYERAVEKLEKNDKPSPRFAVLYFKLAKAYRLSQSYAKAIDAYNRVVELFPGSRQAKEAKKKAEEIY
jgi:Tfp pilus assembly protein PilF